jgi:hypothetical protein
MAFEKFNVDIVRHEEFPFDTLDADGNPVDTWDVTVSRDDGASVWTISEGDKPTQDGELVQRLIGMLQEGQ